MLTKLQEKIQQDINSNSDTLQVFIGARRTGRTLTLCDLAIKTCEATPGAVVAYVVPRSMSIKRLIVPVMKTLNINAEYRVADKEYVFENGSKIVFSGSDNGATEDLRGLSFNLAIVDNAGYCDTLTYLVRSILTPAVRVQKGKIILSCILPKNRSHEFVTEFVLPFLLKGKVKTYSIYDSELSAKEIQDIKQDYTPDEFSREFECCYG